VKRVGVRKFRDHAAQYLSGDESVAVEQNGQLLGFYIPVGGDRPASLAQALERLEREIRCVLDETGLSEDELSRLYDLSERLPARPRGKRRRVTLSPQ
jgi:hypothetical protein